MMTFNQAAAFNAQLLAASQPATPVKSESSNVVATSQSDLSNDPIRFLNASGPLLGPGIPSFHHPMNPDLAAFRAMTQGALPFPAMYPGLPPEMKPEMMGAAAGAIPGFFFDASFGYHPYAGGLDGARRKNATRETTAPLKSWLNEHRKNPYPTKAEKIMLALLTKMTLTQVSTWFANARRRLKKENKMTWSPRNRPGEEDDEDLAEIDRSERDASERPSSSTSEISDIGAPIKSEAFAHERDSTNHISNNDSNNDETASDGDTGDNKHDENAMKSSCSPSPSVENSETPKKSKIWSIADTLSNRVLESSAKKSTVDTSSPSASLTIGKSTPSSSSATDLENSAPSSTPAACCSTASLNSPSNSGPSGAISSVPSTPSAPPPPPPPPHYLPFNPFQQQIAALAMSRMPYQRPELFAMMNQANQMRPVMFNPLSFMSPPALAAATAVCVSSSQQQLSAVPHTVPITASQTNGLSWSGHPSVSPASSTGTTATVVGGGTAEKECSS
ncbi:hypothetical protein AB6A40_002760 [Gnathostoma spinigerum]|uniref:Homeobox domain-containing protein n=1 Tax=Gnathostoma spinigerum TaxID=75299 RepID=A0ABD6EA25_9BILA